MNTIPSEFTVGGIYLPPYARRGLSRRSAGLLDCSPAESLPAVAVFLLSAAGLCGPVCDLYRRCRLSVYPFLTHALITHEIQSKIFPYWCSRSARSGCCPAQVMDI